MRITSARETKKGTTQTRINVDTTGTQVVVIVAEDGWEYSQYDSRKPDRWGRSSRGLQVRISMNGPLRLTTQQWYELSAAIDAELAKTPGVL